MGFLVPESYLDDRKEMKGTRLKLLCRLNCLPLMDRIGRKVVPQWPKEDRLCYMCNLRAIEDVKHFLVDCPAYNARRNKLFTHIATAYPLCIPPTPPPSTNSIFFWASGQGMCMVIVI